MTECGREGGGEASERKGVYGWLRQGQENGHVRRVNEGCNEAYG